MFLVCPSFIWELGALKKPWQSHILFIIFLLLTSKDLYKFALSGPSNAFHSSLLWLTQLQNHLFLLISQASAALFKASNEIVKWLISSCLSFLSLSVLFTWSPSLATQDKVAAACSALQGLPESRLQGGAVCQPRASLASPSRMQAPEGQVSQLLVSCSILPTRIGLKTVF